MKVTLVGSATWLVSVRQEVLRVEAVTELHINAEPGALSCWINKTERQIEQSVLVRQFPGSATRRIDVAKPHPVRDLWDAERQGFALRILDPDYIDAMSAFIPVPVSEVVMVVVSVTPGLQCRFFALSS
jgi:hypothetical protein